MAEIQEYIDSISKAVLGRDVRSSIVNALEKINEDTTASASAASSSAAAAKASEDNAAAALQQIQGLLDGDGEEY